MKDKILQLINEIKAWNMGDYDSQIEHGEVPLDTATIIARQDTIEALEKLLKESN